MRDWELREGENEMPLVQCAQCREMVPVSESNRFCERDFCIPCMDENTSEMNDGYGYTDDDFDSFYNDIERYHNETTDDF